MHARILQTHLKEEACSEDPDVDGRMTLKRFLKNEDLMKWTGFVWLSMGVSDELNVDLYCSNLIKL